MDTDLKLREAFHFFFLKRLLQISDPELYVLKGGVNLRFFFNSPRYSEDMDLDVLGGGVTTLTKNGYKILNDKSFHRNLRTFGIDSLDVNDPDKAKQTKTTQRFRVGLISSSGERLATKVEFSRRKTDTDKYRLDLIDPVIARRYRNVSYQCLHYAGEQAVIQKIRALAGRPVSQARDVFDLGILHSGGHTLSVDVHSALPAEILNKAVDNLLSLSYDDYRGQVLEYIELEHRSQYEGEESWISLQERLLDVLTHEP